MSSEEIEKTVIAVKRWLVWQEPLSPEDEKILDQFEEFINTDTELKNAINQDPDVKDLWAAFLKDK